jgi:hypothetical protein
MYSLSSCDVGLRTYTSAGASSVEHLRNCGPMTPVTLSTFCA